MEVAKTIIANYMVRTLNAREIVPKNHTYVRDQRTFIIFLSITDNYIPILLEASHTKLEGLPTYIDFLIQTKPL